MPLIGIINGMADLCWECSSPLVLLEGVWQCENCSRVLLASDMDLDSVMIEEGQTMGEVMQQYEEK